MITTEGGEGTRTVTLGADGACTTTLGRGASTTTAGRGVCTTTLGGSAVAVARGGGGAAVGPVTVVVVGGSEAISVSPPHAVIVITETKESIVRRSASDRMEPRLKGSEPPT